MADSFLVIGIDFGTTYSGVSWCWSGQPDNIELVTRWKSRLSFTSDSAKTPSEIHYDRKSGSPTWGYDVPIEEEPIRWFKLLLVDEETLPEEFSDSKQLARARQLIRDLKKEPVEVVADYLRLLWQHTLDQLCRDRGDSAVKGLQLKVWLTVPALWDERARQRMRNAAKMAGILDRRTAGPTELGLVAEPEAAALAVLNDLKGRPDVQPGDVLVVCDAGGGTVDIISYEILDVQPLRVRECVEGKGKMCGVIFVDEEFVNMVAAVLGTKWKKVSETSRKMMIHNEWENGIKRLFDDSDKDWTVTVPPEAFDSKAPKLHRFDDKKAEVPLHSGQLRFGRGHIRAFFDRVFPLIRGLIHDQVNAVTQKLGKPPKAILLVGGLGACNYLYQELRAEFVPKDISVLQPNGARPWTAICRGAVIRGLSATSVPSVNMSNVVARVSRLSYGISYSTRFQDDIHEAKDKYWCKKRQEWRANNQMEWFLERGDDIYHEKPVIFAMTSLGAVPSELRELNTSVYSTSEEEAPSRKSDTVNRVAGISVKVDTPFEALPTWTNSEGKVFRELSYDVTMTSDGVSMVWEVIINGKVQGQQNITIEQDVDRLGEDLDERFSRMMATDDYLDRHAK